MLFASLTKLTKVGELFAQHGPQVVQGLFILVFGLLLIKLVVKQIGKFLKRFNIEKSRQASLTKAIHAILILIVFSFMAIWVGVPAIKVFRVIMVLTMVSIAAVYIFRPYVPSLPFKMGHMVQVAGLMGVVEATTFLNTRLRTFDGRTVFIPNKKVLNDIVVNYHFTPTRQVRLKLDIGYEDDIIKVKKVLTEMILEDPRILDEPAARVFVTDIADSSIKVAAWFWVHNSDYWRTRCDLVEKVKLRFDLEGISMPYPQRDVHIYQEAIESHGSDV